MDTEKIPEIDRKRKKSLEAEILKAVHEREKVHEEVEKNKKRRLSMKNEIIDAVEEREKLHEEHEHIKDVAKHQLFPEIQKEVEAHRHKSIQ